MPTDDRRPVPRPEIPPPGRRLEFGAWARVLTAELRRYIPDVAAFANGHDRIRWRYRGLEAMAENDRGVYIIRTDSRWGGFQDGERHDAYTRATLQKRLPATSTQRSQSRILSGSVTSSNRTVS
jgi:hypothetical protein